MDKLSLNDLSLMNSVSLWPSRGLRSPTGTTGRGSSSGSSDSLSFGDWTPIDTLTGDCFFLVNRFLTFVIGFMISP